MDGLLGLEDSRFLTTEGTESAKAFFGLRLRGYLSLGTQRVLRLG